MKKNWFILICSVLFLFNTNAQTCRYLIWSDEFNVDGAPNPLNWGYDLGYIANNEFQTYVNSSNNARIENGELVIEAIKDANGNWTSARLQSQNKQLFTHGRIEFKAKVPVGDGVWPALWMLGQNISSANWPGCGEIDIMEAVGKDPGVNHGSLHTASSYGNTVNTGTTNVENFSTAFHIYAIEWTSTKIAFYVDELNYYTYNPTTKNDQTWPFDKPFFIIMNVAMGGSWGSVPKYETGGLKNGIDPALTSAKMEIDWVRVYSTELPQITGKSLVVENTIESYSVPAMDNTTFLWGVPDGATITAGQATNSITVQWGTNPGNVTLSVTQQCGTSVITPLPVRLKTIPTTDTYTIPNLDDLGNNQWQEFSTSGNTMSFTLTPDFTLNYNITAPQNLPTIVHPITNVNLSHYNYVALNLKTDKNNPPSAVRLDIIDSQDRPDYDHVLAITNFNNDDAYHTYAVAIASSAEFDLSAVTGMKMYVNYGATGKVSNSKIWFNDVQFSVNNPMGIKTINKNALYKLFPNPAKEIVYIEPYNNIVTITVMDMTSKSYGYTLSANGSIDIHALPQGIYSLIVTDKQHQKTAITFAKQ